MNTYVYYMYICIEREREIDILIDRSIVFCFFSESDTRGTVLQSGSMGSFLITGLLRRLV